MKNYKKALFSFLSAILIISAFFLLKNGEKPPISPTTSRVIKKSTKKPLKQQEQSKKRIPLKLSRYKSQQGDKVQSSFPAECLESFDQLSQMTSDEYVEIIKSKYSFNDFFTSQCLISLKKNQIFTKLSKNSQCDLLNQNFEFKEENVYGPCTTLLFTLKAYAISDHAKSIPVEKMTSEELAANFVKMFFSIDKLNKETFKNNLNLIDTFYEMHSNDPNVVEAYLGYLMIAQQVTGENFANEKLNSVLTNSTGNSFKLDRLSVLKSVINKDLVHAKSTLDKLNNYYNNEPELQYYYAAYYWKNGDKAMANKYLDKAIEMGNKCSYCVPSLYKDTKKRLKTAKAGDDKLFSISIGLNFENL